MRNIIDTLFPIHPQRTAVEDDELLNDIPLFSVNELPRATDSTKQDSVRIGLNFCGGPQGCGTCLSKTAPGHITPLP